MDNHDINNSCKYSEAVIYMTIANTEKTMATKPIITVITQAVSSDEHTTDWHTHEWTSSEERKRKERRMQCYTASYFLNTL